MWVNYCCITSHPRRWLNCNCLLLLTCLQLTGVVWSRLGSAWEAWLPMSHPQACTSYGMAEPQVGQQKHAGLLRPRLLLAPWQICSHSFDRRMTHGLSQKQGVAIYSIFYLYEGTKNSYDKRYDTWGGEKLKLVMHLTQWQFLRTGNLVTEEYFVDDILRMNFVTSVARYSFPSNVESLSSHYFQENHNGWN